jgi:cytochrome P450
MDSSPSFDQLESLKYLNNVCREVLRFIPPGTLPLRNLTLVGMTVRRADKDDMYNNIKIRKGTPIFFSPNVNNFDPSTWGSDVMTFNPDRWGHLPSSNSNYSYLTFLQGIIAWVEVM